jgi:starch synthase (maltosyl-transferring)
VPTFESPAPRVGRIPIRHLRPRQPEDLAPSKAYVGEVVPFEATIFREGHDLLGAEVELVSPDGVETTHRMLLEGAGTDHWVAPARLDAAGSWRWRVRAWSDDWATWLHTAEIKVPAGLDVDLVFASGPRPSHRSA